MDIRREITFDADVDSVVAMMLDREFLERRCAASHAVAYTVDVPAGASPASTEPVVVRIHRSLSTAGMPDIVHRFVGQTIEIDEQMRWLPATGDGTRTALDHLQVRGVPVSMSGTLVLTPEGGRTRQTVEQTLKASIPLLGSRVEKAAAPVVADSVDLDERLGAEYLANR